MAKTKNHDGRDKKTMAAETNNSWQNEVGEDRDKKTHGRDKKTRCRAKKSHPH